MMNILYTLWFYVVSLLQCLCEVFRRLGAFAYGSPSAAMVGRTFTFDNGLRIEIIQQIAEGGFSIVYSAKEHGNNNNNSKRFALKQVICHDADVMEKCREESSVHKMFPNHPNLMPLVALKFDRKGRYGEFHGTICYMLFPLYESSLRDQITKRNLITLAVNGGTTSIAHPWTERELIEIFTGIVDGVKAMHHQGYTHRDIKLENVLLDRFDTPVLMDFGSAGPLTIPIPSRSALSSVFDDAATNTTMSYRAPELFEGGARYGEIDIDGRIDVWALGCVLFGMMYGLSPFECEFRGDTVKVVECSHLRVLGNVPVPSPGTKLASRYSPVFLQTVQWMLNQDRTKRPTIDQVSTKVDQLLRQFHGTRFWLSSNQRQVMEIDRVLTTNNDSTMTDSSDYHRERESLV